MTAGGSEPGRPLSPLAGSGCWLGVTAGVRGAGGWAVGWAGAGRLPGGALQAESLILKAVSGEDGGDATPSLAAVPPPRTDSLHWPALGRGSRAQDTGRSAESPDGAFPGRLRWGFQERPFGKGSGQPHKRENPFGGSGLEVT